MKKKVRIMVKKTLSLVLSAVLLFACLAVPAFAEETATFSTAAEVNGFVVMDRSFTTPMRLVPATLTADGVSRGVYFIAMLGYKSNRAQVNSGASLFPAAFGLRNPYFDFAKQTILENVPEGSALVLGGHSLGGMVAQKLRVDPDLKERYEIVNVLTCGSPLIMIDESAAEGTLVRMADVNDAVPFLSPATLVCLSRQIRTAVREDGGYAFDPDSAHNDSYARADLWGGYDALGVKGGNASLSFDPAAVVSYGVAE